MADRKEPTTDTDARTVPDAAPGEIDPEQFREGLPPGEVSPLQRLDEIRRARLHSINIDPRGMGHIEQERTDGN